MEYIDKNKSREKAHRLIKDFLDRVKKECKTYPDDLYAAFRGNKDCKDELVSLLLDDSGHHCCYCMASIDGTTIEHVILNSIKSQEQFDKYFEKESELDRSNIRLAKDFIESQSDVPPFPHTIAYENLIPSCFGYLSPNSCSSKCCNIYRGEKFVYPLVFRKNINSEIIYYSDGRVEWSKDPEEVTPTITKLGLDCAELKAIRRIWCFLSSKNLSCDDKNRELTINCLIDELEDSQKEKNMLNMLLNFKNKEYWKLLEKYQYFNDYSKFKVTNK